LPHFLTIDRWISDHSVAFSAPPISEHSLDRKVAARATCHLTAATGENKARPHHQSAVKDPCSIPGSSKHEEPAKGALDQQLGSKHGLIMLAFMVASISLTEKGVSIQPSTHRKILLAMVEIEGAAQSHRRSLRRDIEVKLPQAPKTTEVNFR
jgi:hypothetical protein